MLHLTYTRLFGALSFVFFCLSALALSGQSLVLSEASSANTLLVDADDDTPDWVELRNPTDQPIDLSGWAIADRPNYGDAWKLPGITLPAGAFVVIWASGKDRRPATLSGLHANFRLAASGETVYLFNPNGNPVMALPLPRLSANTSRGFNAAGDLVYYDAPTPGTQNPPSTVTGRTTDRVHFSHQGGPTEPLTVALSGGEAGAEIRYTSDGSRPTRHSPRYVTALAIDTTTVIRARVFRPNALPGPVGSKTFVVEANHNLPIITLATDPAHFFDPATGIYVDGDGPLGPFPYLGANYWRDWERPVDVALYTPTGVQIFSLPAGAKIFGGNNRTRAQRSLSLFARPIYGAEAIEAPVFKQRAATSYQNLVLRNSGGDWNRSMLRDGMMTSLLEGSGLDVQAYRPAVLYLNGEYWGIHNLREKVNEHFFARNHGTDEDELDLLEYQGDVIHGSNTEYRELIDFVLGRQALSDDDYAYVADQVDVDNLIMYNVAQTYFSNRDWPHNNVKFWRETGGKWHWILYDSDWGFNFWTDSDYEDNHFEYAFDNNSNQLIRQLLTNLTFRNRFINRFADELNSRFLPDAVITHIDTLVASIAAEVPNHSARWGGTLENWPEQLERMRNFAENRPPAARDQVLDYFSLPAHHLVAVTNESLEAGFVKLNTLTLRDTSWQGTYFASVPIQLSAIAYPGHEFLYWRGDVFSADSILTIDPDRPLTVEPVFREIDSTNVVTRTVLDQVGPNPSTGELRVKYELERSGEVELDVYDTSGRMVTRLWKGSSPFGLNAITF
ncbi:MAG: CotH kinase family protein, partial [Bacteroidota bacterium]